MSIFRVERLLVVVVDPVCIVSFRRAALVTKTVSSLCPYP